MLWWQKYLFNVDNYFSYSLNPKKYETNSLEKDKLHAENTKCRKIMIKAWLSQPVRIKGIVTARKKSISRKLIEVVNF